MHTHRLQRILSTVRSTTQLHFCNLNVSKNLMSKDLLQQLNLHCMCFWMSINKSSFIIFCWVNTYIRLETAFPTGFPFATAQQQLPDCLENCESIFSNIYPGAESFEQKGNKTSDHFSVRAQVYPQPRKQRLRGKDSHDIKLFEKKKWNQELKIELHFLLGSTQTTLSALHKFYYCCSKWYYHKSH